MNLVTLDSIDSFRRSRSVVSKSINPGVIATIKALDERDEIEPWILSILDDTNSTPHGPAEIADIITHKLMANGKDGLAAFVIKGKSFPTVRPSHISHQIFRLHRIGDLSLAVLAASGDVLDDVKEQFIHTAKSIGCQYTFLDAHDLARLFVGYGYVCPRDGNRIRKGRCECGYTPDTRTSNILQEEALRSLSEAHARHTPAGAIVLPTGAGKTYIAAKDIARYEANSSIYIAHTKEIIDDTAREMARHFGQNEVKILEKSIDFYNLSKINLTTIQLISRNLKSFDRKEIDYLVIDEFHHAAAKSYKATVEALKPKFLLGLTATPFRGDGQDVIKICGGNILTAYDLRQGIEFGILCPYHYYGCFDNVDYSKIAHTGSRYDIRDLERALIVPERHAAIVRKWTEKAEDKPTIAFCCSHEHAERIASSFVNAGISAKTFLSTHARSERLLIREEFSNGRTKILCVVDLLNEGVDLPFVECLLFVRPTESKRVFFQQLGRGLRRYVGKEWCTVIDFIGNFRNAYRIAEYQGLEPVEDPTSDGESDIFRRAKENVVLPAGCQVEFDEKVIDIFGLQTLDPAFATRHNIESILLFQYRKLEKNIGYEPSRRDIDRYCLLGTWYYDKVFGSWANFRQKLTCPP